MDIVLIAVAKVQMRQQKDKLSLLGTKGVSMEPKCYKCNQAYMHKEKISGYGYVCTCPNCGARYIVY